MKPRLATLLAAGLLAAFATAALPATPAAASHRHHHGYFPYAPHYAYDYGPAYYPPPVLVAPPPVVAAPVFAAPVMAAPVVAGPVLPPPVPTALPPAAAGYPAGPVPPDIEGTPGCLVVREYTTEIEVGGKPVEGYGYACLQADGSWKRGAPVPVR